MSFLIYIIVLLLVCISLLCSYAFFYSMPNSDFKICLLEHLYHKDCTTTRQSWLFLFYIVIDNKQDEMKLENILNKLQSSFILLQFIHLSLLCYTAKVSDWLVPRNAKELHSFLGLVSYYCWFIPNFAHIAKCLH